MGRHARPTRRSILPSMRSRKQAERLQLLMESSLAYPRGKEGKSKNIRRGKLERRVDTRVPRGREARHTWRRCAPKGALSGGRALARLNDFAVET
ncbi:hypothetical protein AVEN_60590-1 [Araneus ventricosus]|uniref:Uncharacterized protein n=1 Tax=Araneus ventricosus TaxID=182803 RepID=A0A4Y2EYC9_ARAVE|nr:hypothetical protein AVEN_60590-1 [Araneus ventricosus]